MPPISELLKSITNRLVAINVGVYFLVQALFAETRSGFELYFWQHPDFQIWQPLSSMFLHGGLSHLAFNMLALWSFGRVLERAWGNQRFLIFYLACGLGAAVIALLVNQFEFQYLTNQLIEAGIATRDIETLLASGQFSEATQTAAGRDALEQFYFLYHTPMVGASGAIYGILVAFALLFPNFKIMLIFLPVPIPAKFFVPVLLLIDLTAGITGISIFGQNIAHFAHLGGALIGFLLVMFWLKANP